MASKKGVEHNRLLLAFNMMRGGMNVMVAWRESGKKIARSKGQLNRRKGSRIIGRPRGVS